MVLPQLLDNQVFFFFVFQESAVELDFPCFKLAFHGCLFRSRVGFAFFLSVSGIVLEENWVRSVPCCVGSGRADLQDLRKTAANPSF